MLTATSWLEHDTVLTRTRKIIINEKSQVHIHSYTILVVSEEIGNPDKFELRTTKTVHDE